MLVDGAASVLSGLAGAMGTNTASANVGLAADGVRRLAGFLVRHNADRARATVARGRVTIHFHFDH